MRTSRVVALAFVVGTFFVAQQVLTDLAAGKSVSIRDDLETVLHYWGVWALLTPVVILAVRRWPLDARPLYRPLLVHAVIATLLASAHHLLTVLLPAVMHYGAGGLTVEQLSRLHPNPNAFAWGVFTGACFYAVVVMVYTAVRFHALYVTERVSTAELASRSAALEAELTRSKLDTLRSQLRPHFLFNTLNAISVFVTEDADRAQQMILRLSTLLRRSLDEEAHEVPLRQELEFVQDYLDIQHWRFGDRLSVRLDVDPDVLDACVPVFLLQPLLENAIEHGRSDDRPTIVVLSAARHREALHLTLEDDGPGIAAGGQVRDGIGLRNTRARLHHLHGQGATVSLGAALETTTSQGTRVEIRLPFRETPT